MSSKVFSVGFDFPGGECELVTLRSERSLLDADIVIFEPGLAAEYDYGEPYGGKPTMQEYSSVEFKTDLKHWRSELANAYNAGKTILIFLAKPQTVYVHTGRTEWSGTGRNARKTKIVEPADTYSALPWDLGEVVPAKGENVRRANDIGALSEYWNLCSQYSPYQVYLSEKLKQPVLFTKAGNKVVGTYIGNGVGSVFLVPPIDSDSSQFVRKVRGDLNWTPYARKFGKELMACLIGLHTALIAERVDSPPPGWVEDSCYSIPEEIALTQAIDKIDRDLGELTGAKNSLIAKKKTVGGMRRLLYEKGRPLENAVIKVLHLMSFEAQAFKDGESEFDVVFVSPEGRFLGEVEGKDNKAINIDKHSQLERNVNEDFERDGVTEHAHGVLFGNGFRLLPLRERKDFFTEKCASAAKRTGTALVRTPDLFEVARYLESSEDKAFAALCRKAIIENKGEIVQFPPIPETVPAIDGKTKSADTL